jgi:hypothetical protein
MVLDSIPMEPVSVLDLVQGGVCHLRRLLPRLFASVKYAIGKKHLDIVPGFNRTVLDAVVPTPQGMWEDQRSYQMGHETLATGGTFAYVQFVRAQNGFNGAGPNGELFDNNQKSFLLAIPQHGSTGDPQAIQRATSTWRGPFGVFYDFYIIINANNLDFLPSWLRGGIPTVEHLTMTGIGSWTRFVFPEQ